MNEKNELCPRCGAVKEPLSAEALEGSCFPRIWPGPCGDCVEKEREDAKIEESRRIIRRRAAEWANEFGEYDDTNPDHPRAIPGAKSALLASFRDCGKGVALVGPPGRVKTRLLLWLAKQMFMVGRDVHFITSAEFGRYAAGKFSHEDEYRERSVWELARCRECDFLFFDDLGHEKATETYCVEFKALLDERSRPKPAQPMYWSSNFGGQSLIDKFGDHGAAIVRRLDQLSTFVTA